jgi:hypothetical protein
VLHRTLRKLLDECDSLGEAPAALDTATVSGADAFRIVMEPLGDEYLPPMTEDELTRNREGAWRRGLDGNFGLYGEAVTRAAYIGHTLHHLRERNTPEAPYLEALAARLAAGETGADRQLTFLRNDRADGPALLAELERKFAEGI